LKATSYLNATLDQEGIVPAHEGQHFAAPNMACHPLPTCCHFTVALVR
jgi:hypothetical protein